MVRLAKTVHLSCTNATTVSKWIETRFQMTNVTQKIHRVRPKGFLSLGYVQCKPCSYLALRLALFQIDQNEHPLQPPYLGVPSGVSKMIYVPMVCLAKTMHLSSTNATTVSKWRETSFHVTNVTKEIHRVRPNGFLRLCYVWRKPCAYLTLRITLSPNGQK
jgi:hypothetical protein